MSADDQTFLDTLSAVPNDIKRYSVDVADYVDKHLEKVSNVLRDALSQQEWLGSARPRPSRPPPSRVRVVPKTVLGRVCEWMDKNRWLTCAIVLATGGVIYYGVKAGTGRKKRRAKRATNGARIEVVILAGSPSDPITKTLSQDLERRGFIVYIVCNSEEEEALVQNDSRSDVRPLLVDITDTESTEEAIERFTTYLQSPQHAFQGARPHNLTLRSLILIPSQTYPTLPLSTIPPATLSDLLNTRLLTPLLTIRAFLPLLHTSPYPQPKPMSPKLQHKPSVLLLTPGIISSLNPAFHLPEAAISGALTSAAEVLSAELSPLGVPVTHVQLGTFDFSSIVGPRTSHPLTVGAQRAETLKWDASSRQAYAKNFVALTSKGRLNHGKGSSLRELNDTIFDAMMRSSGGVIRVGVGMGLYGFVGRWVPRGIVGWMMGLRRNDLQQQRDVEFGRMITDGSDSDKSRSESPELSRDDGPFVYGLGSDFVDLEDKELVA